MNRWEQEFQHLTLEEQRKVLEAIRNTYEQAARDCQNRIAQLNARTDMQNLQSIIYRRQYQEAILNQINETLADLNATNYETIHDYVEQCYVNGYIGAMYDLSQQGIPIITPIDQRDVFRATVTDSRLSEGLYSALGEDVNELKDAVRRELSRGIAQGSSWVDVARNLSTHMVNSPFRTAMNNSMRIARTEGHRVQMQGSMDALHVAKDKGADVLKQWDAALDANTRTSHQHVDGEIREVDEKFSNGLLFPSDPKGSAAEVINCRCALLHRARWALDESELETLKKRAEYFGLDKTDNFNDYKKKYLGITDETVPDSSKEVEHSDAFNKLNDGFKANKIKYREVKKLDSPLTEDEIIKKIAGDDKTSGSCVSQALTYIGNKFGLDVRDLRGGDSCYFFSRFAWNRLIGDLNNVEHHEYQAKKEVSTVIGLLNNLEIGKEYMLLCGRHASIVRRLETGLEYLELQSSTESGWTSFMSYGSVSNTLVRRFGCSRNPRRILGTVVESEIELFDVDSFRNCDELAEVLGYLNTAEENMRRGAGGGIK